MLLLFVFLKYFLLLLDHGLEIFVKSVKLKFVFATNKTINTPAYSDCYSCLGVVTTNINTAAVCTYSLTERRC